MHIPVQTCSALALDIHPLKIKTSVQRQNGVGINSHLKSVSPVLGEEPGLQEPRSRFMLTCIGFLQGPGGLWAQGPSQSHLSLHSHAKQEPRGRLPERARPPPLEPASPPGT
ncbi:hypothetical protein SKAU_G00327590 [Synaphobranchus kaupii]|uniref:Uncharacterized protein n=1 Tax=Synaphobranchus kaupii TaxID=118154 RepID=A0A9Q1EQ47_SYNKA|nr:hypothetical protein SKAU_G00327590 [Synaphobranchus kaupii]